MDGNGIMFLRILIILIVSVLSVKAAIYENEFYNKSIVEKNIKILKKIQLRKPKDLKNLQRLVQLYFINEDFLKAEKHAIKYLKLKENKDVAYIKIISLANQNKYRQSIIEINKFINNYKINETEVKNILKKKKLYSNALRSNQFPQGAVRINQSKNKLFIGINSREKYLIGYEKKYNRLFYYYYEKNITKYKYNNLKELNNLSISKIIFVAYSIDAREILISLKTNDGAEILHRKYNILTKNWGELKKISSINPGSYNSFANFSSDSSSIFFVSNSDKNKNFNLFYVTRDFEGNWSAPKKIKKVNTALDEYSIFLHADGETICFSSNGKIGKGGFDLYGSKLVYYKNNYYLSNIKNISKCNTFRNENYPLLINSTADLFIQNFIFSNNIYNYKYKDISISPVSVYYFDGFVYDKATKKRIKDASVKISKFGKNELRGEQTRKTYVDGYFSFSLRDKAKYLLSITAPGYIYYKENISIDNNLHILKRKFYLKKGKIKKGYLFIAKNIYFDTGSANLKTESAAELSNIYNFLKSNPNIQIEISGYTDNVGSFRYNLKLSVKRAQAIANYLIKRKISKDRLLIKGFGFKKNVASNESEIGRQKNRRVEIKVIKNE